MPHLVLASTSPYRLRLLQRWGIPFEARNPGVDESPYKSKGLSPHDIVCELAEAKARAAQKIYPESVIIGADQVLSFGDKIYGKAGSEQKALNDLMTFRGNTQHLITGLCVLYQNQKLEHTDLTKITFRSFTRDEALAVIQKDKSWDCAGSLKIECSGTWLIQSLETQDPSAIEGLPLIKLGEMLRTLGFKI